MRNETQKNLTTARLLCLLGGAALLSTGCPGAKSGTNDDAGTQHDGAVDNTTDPTGDGGTTAHDAGTGKDGAVTTDGDGSVIKDDAGADGSVALVGPMFTDATAQQTGRFGGDVQFALTGKAVTRNAIALSVQMYASTNDDILLGDHDGDGALDVGAVEFPLSAPITRAGGKASAIVEGVGAANGDLGHAIVALVDDQGTLSDAMDITITPQPVLASGDPCDKTYHDDRCGANLGCKGTPATCSASEAPSVDAATRYLDDTFGARILIIGDDADDDIDTYHLRYLDGSGNPVNVSDTDGNGSPDSADADGKVEEIGAGGKVFVSSMLTPNAAQLVLAVDITLTDLAGNVSAVQRVSKTATPTIAAGANCDMRLFNRCATNNVCIPTAADSVTGKCTATSSARTKACAAALVLDPAKGITDVRGQISQPSLWDAPLGCTSVAEKFRPEQLVKLTLAADADQVTISTNHPYTSIDSVIYVLASCTGEARTGAGWCVDDIDFSLPHSEQAAIVLPDMKKGDYYIVVDSHESTLTGTTFEIDVLVE